MTFKEQMVFKFLNMEVTKSRINRNIQSGIREKNADPFPIEVENQDLGELQMGEVKLKAALDIDQFQVLNLSYMGVEKFLDVEKKDDSWKVKTKFSFVSHNLNTEIVSHLRGSGRIINSPEYTVGLGSKFSGNCEVINSEMIGFLDVKIKYEHIVNPVGIERMQLIENLNITFDKIEVNFDQIEFLSKYLTNLSNVIVNVFKNQILQRIGSKLKPMINEILKEKYEPEE